MEAGTGINYSPHQPNAAEVAVTEFGYDRSPWETCFLQGHRSCPGQGLLASFNLDTFLRGRNPFLKRLSVPADMHLPGQATGRHQVPSFSLSIAVASAQVITVPHLDWPPNWLPLLQTTPAYHFPHAWYHCLSKIRELLPQISQRLPATCP